MIEKSPITGRQIAAARVLAGLDQATLAERADVSIATLRRMEASGGEASGYRNNVEAVRRVLEETGISFMNGGDPGVKLKRTGGVGTRFAAGEFASSSGMGLTGVGTRFAAGEFARVVEQLRELTVRASAEAPSKEELLVSVEAISPALAEKIAPYLTRKGVFFIIAVFLWIIHVNVNVEINLKATVDLNQIFDSAVRAIEGDE